MTPRIWIEPFAGSAAVTLAVLGGLRLRPPIAYMGAKTSLAYAILAALGIAPGAGAGAVVLCDGGPWGRCWQALLDPETNRAVSDVLMGWRHERPIELWRRLAAEPPPEDLVAHVATVLWLQGRAASNVPLWWDDGRSAWAMPTAPRPGHPNGGVYDATARTGRERADVATGWRMASGNGRIDPDVPLAARSTDSPSASSGLQSTATVARRCDAIAETVARFLTLQALAIQNRPAWPEGGRWLQGRGLEADGEPETARPRSDAGSRGITSTRTIGRRVTALGGAPFGLLTAVHGDIDDAVALLPDDLTGCAAFLDPPYVGATRYAAECGRDRVLALARNLDARGCVVAISEAVPLDDLAGWNAVELTDARVGKRPGSKRAKSEWLTLNRPPVRVPVAQARLFAVGS